MKKTIKERLVDKGLITTCIGVIILLIAVGMWVVKDSTMEEVGLIAGYGLLFLRSKDSLIGIKE